MRNDLAVFALDRGFALLIAAQASLKSNVQNDVAPTGLIERARVVD